MNYKHFTIEEREIIQAMRWRGVSLREISRMLKRSSSSVSREVKKNFTEEKKVYTPRLAHKRALFKRTRRGREEHLKNDRIRSYVITHLERRWSPEQISNSIKQDLNECISHEAIYRFIYDRVASGSNITKTGVEDLRPYLRRRRRIRMVRGARKCQRIWKTKGPSIDERPREVETRKTPGHWEGDSVESVDHRPGINTLVERKVGLVFITRLRGRSSEATVGAMALRFKDVPERFKKTVTLDNGPENRDWKSIESEIGIKCYMAHPYHSWERGTNENTNGLIRDYFPKKTDFSIISDDEVRFVEDELNSRPRKRLGWKTPLQAWSDALQC
ncbi:MAG: IS30 family transposase [Candidatus Taylorbacteria bacterium]|nr:IS30 family transposase [Candidatus Taylorbacteria bacterium]